MPKAPQFFILQKILGPLWPKMQQSQWVSAVFQNATVFSCIDAHLAGIDLVRLMRTCRALYWEWLTVDPKRWWRLQSLRQLCDVLTVPIHPNGPSPLPMVRQIAMDAWIEPDDSLETLKVCIRCTLPGHSCNVTRLRYAICVRCARHNPAAKRIVKQVTHAAGLVESPAAMFDEMVFGVLGEEEFRRSRWVINQVRLDYVRTLRCSREWAHLHMYSIEAIKTLALELVSELKYESDE